MDEDSQMSDFLGFPCIPERQSYSYNDKLPELKDGFESTFMEEDTKSQLISVIQLQFKNSFYYKPVIFNETKETSNDSDELNEGDFLGFLNPSENLDTLYDKKNITKFVKKMIIRNRSFQIFFLHSYDRSVEVTQKTTNDMNIEEDCNESLMLSDKENVSSEEGEEFVSDYERIRLNNIKERTEFLIKMGLIKPPSVKIRKNRIVKVNRINKSLPYPTRRSARLSHSLDDFEFLSLPDEDEIIKQPRSYVKRKNEYGIIKGVPIGESWRTRLECNAAGIHRPTVAGIHPGQKGAYSVVLSGGYDDDIDNGDTFTYTGSGGRDLKGTKANPKNLRTAPQTKDQTLNMGNSALIYSCTNKKPIRVVRGYKLKSPYAPLEGYRYDGLYVITKWSLNKGLSGYLTYKFFFKRCTDQDPPPWS